MATKGIAVVQNIGYSGTNGQANVSFSYCSCDGSHNVDSGDTIDIVVGIGFDEAIRDYVQSALEAGGVSFTPVVDSLRIGQNLLVAT